MNTTSEIKHREENADESQAANDFSEMVSNLSVVLDSDLFGCDAIWTLFVSAALSYRYDSLLKPFPPKFINEDGPNINELINVINEVPPLRMILNNIVEKNYDELDLDVIELVHWVLVSERDPMLESVSSEEYDLIISQIMESHDTAKPAKIFKVVPAQNSSIEEKFETKKGRKDTNLAFHGNKLMNFYYILNHGLNQDVCKNGPFGEEIYLSTKLSVSKNYSPTGPAWGASLCGPYISSIAVCEYINTKEYANTRIKEGSEVLEPYIVVTNNEVVRVRYLLFYDNIRDECSPRNLGIYWVNRNKYFLAASCFTLFLALIGMAYSGNGMYILQIIIKKCFDIMKLFKNLFSADT